jgi:REP element-mobilizing transposase RayT
VNRRSFNAYGAPKIRQNGGLEKSDKESVVGQPFRLDAGRRREVEAAIKQVCDGRGYGLAAINVRSNHAHVVTRTGAKPELVMNGFKSYATRRLRELGLANKNEKVWSRHGSTRYLWTEEQVEMAVQYVLFGQGDELPKF